MFASLSSSSITPVYTIYLSLVDFLTMLTTAMYPGKYTPGIMSWYLRDASEPRTWRHMVCQMQDQTVFYELYVPPAYGSFAIASSDTWVDINFPQRSHTKTPLSTSEAAVGGGH